MINPSAHASEENEQILPAQLLPRAKNDIFVQVSEARRSTIKRYRFEIKARMNSQAPSAAAAFWLSTQ